MKHDRTLTASIKHGSTNLLTETQFISVLEPLKIKYPAIACITIIRTKQELNAGVCDLF